MEARVNQLLPLVLRQLAREPLLVRLGSSACRLRRCGLKRCGIGIGSFDRFLSRGGSRLRSGTCGGLCGSLLGCLLVAPALRLRLLLAVVEVVAVVVVVSRDPEEGRKAVAAGVGARRADTLSGRGRGARAHDGHRQHAGGEDFAGLVSEDCLDADVHAVACDLLEEINAVRIEGRANGRKDFGQVGVHAVGGLFSFGRRFEFGLSGRKRLEDGAVLDLENGGLFGGCFSHVKFSEYVRREIRRRSPFSSLRCRLRLDL